MFYLYVFRSTYDIFREILDCFTRIELLNWNNFQASFSDTLRMGSGEEPPTDVLTPNTDDGDKHWEELRKRVVEHVSPLMLFFCSSFQF